MGKRLFGSSNLRVGLQVLCLLFFFSFIDSQATLANYSHYGSVDLTPRAREMVEIDTAVEAVEPSNNGQTLYVLYGYTNGDRRFNRLEAVDLRDPEEPTLAWSRNFGPVFKRLILRSDLERFYFYREPSEEGRPAAFQTWSLADGRFIDQLDIESLTFESTSFHVSPDGTQLLYDGSWENPPVPLVYDLSTHQQIRRLVPSESNVGWSSRLACNGSVVVTEDGASVFLWDLSLQSDQEHFLGRFVQQHPLFFSHPESCYGVSDDEIERNRGAPIVLNLRTGEAMSEDYLGYEDPKHEDGDPLVLPGDLYVTQRQSFASSENSGSSYVDVRDLTTGERVFRYPPHSPLDEESQDNLDQMASYWDVKVSPDRSLYLLERYGVPEEPDYLLVGSDGQRIQRIPGGGRELNVRVNSSWSVIVTRTHGVGRDSFGTAEVWRRLE